MDNILLVHEGQSLCNSPSPRVDMVSRVPELVVGRVEDLSEGVVRVLQHNEAPDLHMQQATWKQ